MQGRSSGRLIGVAGIVLLFTGLAVTPSGGSHSIAPEALPSAALEKSGSDLDQASVETASAGSGPSPPYMGYPAITWDGQEGYALLFGGMNVNNEGWGQTWAYENSSWTNLTPTLPVAPAPRLGAAMAFDPAANYTLLFGGCADWNCDPAFGDTWIFESGRWTDLTGTLAVSPAARGLATMVYDAADGYMVLFGGRTTSGTTTTFYSDTWIFSGGQWQNITNSSTGIAPTGRSEAGMAYDSVSGQVVLFGGDSAGGLLADTWTFHAGRWTQVTTTPANSPSARRGNQMAYDSLDGYVLLFGGYNDGTYYGDTWAFNGQSWSNVPATNPPTPRYAAGITFDPRDGYVVLFAGIESAGYLHSTWGYASGRWTAIINPTTTVLTALGLLVAISSILLLIPVVFVGAGLGRRWIVSRQHQTFDTPAGESVRWFDSAGWLKPPGLTAAITGLLGFLLALETVLSASSTAGLAYWLAALFSPTTSAATFWGVIAIYMVLAFVGARLIVAGTMVTRVGVAHGGIILQYPRGDRKIPWAALQPGLTMKAPRNRFTLRYITAKGPASGGMFQATLEQARTILSDARCPESLLSDLVAAAIGFAHSGRPPGTPVAPSLSPGASPASYSFIAPLPPPPQPPPTPVPSPPTGYANPPLASPQLMRPRTPLPGTILCPHCGSPTPERYAFCSVCGQRTG